MNFSWYIKRLGAMRPSELIYRVSQGVLQRKERKLFAKRIPVYEIAEYETPPRVSLSCLGLNAENNNYTVGREIELLGSFSYAEYRVRWHAAFQGDTDWPLKYAGDYLFSADDAPGDIRTNWELNRHHQFAILAKSYYVTGQMSYLVELLDLFESWNRDNPFMWGPEWASPMEASIRLINWLVAAAFLEVSAGSDKETVSDLCSKFEVGAWVMAAHVRRHYSRYSSANNHTIVEAAGVGIASAVFGKEDWLDEATSILETEIRRQTWPDGVNKEQALHYQLFTMEALCLFSHVLHISGRAPSEGIASLARSMAGYVYACSVGKGRYIEFGDDDEGAILNLSPHKEGYPNYVLALVTLEFSNRYRWTDNIAENETTRWLYADRELGLANDLPLQVHALVEHFPDGGVTLLRSDDGRMVLAFDYGPLGLGPLAAHGHADALSVQLFVGAQPVLIDPGTYVYNGNPSMREFFRSTKAHNTVCFDGGCQSEALGPFLWGKRAECDCVRTSADGVLARCRWQDGITKHTREVCMLGNNSISIQDAFESPGGSTVFASFHFAPGIEISVEGDSLTAAGDGFKADFLFEGAAGISLEQAPWSPRYGIEGFSAVARVALRCNGVSDVHILKTLIEEGHR